MISLMNKAITTERKSVFLLPDFFEKYNATNIRTIVISMALIHEPIKSALYIPMSATLEVKTEETLTFAKVC